MIFVSDENLEEKHKILVSEYGVPSVNHMLLMVGKSFEYESDVYEIRSLIFTQAQGYPRGSYIVKKLKDDGTENWIPEDIFKFIKDKVITILK